MKRTIPYPAVFRDWQFPEERRVGAYRRPGGIAIEMLVAKNKWTRVELTEDDACLYAAKLLLLAGEEKLSNKVLKRKER